MGWSFADPEMMELIPGGETAPDDPVVEMLTTEAGETMTKDAERHWRYNCDTCKTDFMGGLLVLSSTAHFPSVCMRCSMFPGTDQAWKVTCSTARMQNFIHVMGEPARQSQAKYHSFDGMFDKKYPEVHEDRVVKTQGSVLKGLVWRPGDTRAIRDQKGDVSSKAALPDRLGHRCLTHASPTWRANMPWK